MEIKENAKNKMVYIEDEMVMVFSKATLTLQDFEVPVKLQGQGLGRKLIKMAIEWGAYRLTAEAYKEGMDQENLVKFYESEGFKIVSTSDNSAYMEREFPLIKVDNLEEVSKTIYYVQEVDLEKADEIVGYADYSYPIFYTDGNKIIAGDRVK